MQSPQLEIKGQQNKRIVQQNGKQSPQLRAKVIQRKQQNVKHSPQLESVQSETKSHQIKEMRKQGDRQYRLSWNLQNEHQPDNSKHQPQLVDSSCQDSLIATSQVMQYPQSEDVLKEHQPDNSQYQLQLVDTSNLDNSGDNSAATSQDLQSPQSGNVQNQHCSSKSYPQRDNYKYQPQLVDMSCKDISAATLQYLQFPKSGKIQNGHHPDNIKNQRQLEDSLRQDSSLASYLQSSQSEKVQNQHQPDNNKYQPQLVGTSCLDNSVATSEVNYPQSDNIKNQHCSYQPYPHLDIRTSQPQQVDTSHQESSTSKEDLDSTSNWQDAKQSPQGLIESNQDQTNKPYLQLDIRTYQPQQVNSSCKESSEDPTSGKGVASAVSKNVMQYLQLEAVLYKQQPSKHYPQLDNRTYQPQWVDTSRQESSDDQPSSEELVSTKQSPQRLIVPNQQQTSKPYPQLDIRIYQPQRIDTSRQESYDDPSSGKELSSTIDKVKSGAVYHALAQLEDQHLKEAADSVVLWNWIFNRSDPRPGILSTINCHMAGENLVVKGFNVNLTRVQIAKRSITPPDPVVVVTCSLENVMPAFVGESNLGPKFVIPGAAYQNTTEDTLHVINTTGNCDTPSDTESEFRTALLSVMKIQALEPTTCYLPGLDDQYAAVPEHIQDIWNCGRSELTQYFHLQGSSFIGGIFGDTCTLINYCQKAVMVTSSEGSDPETSRIWDPGGATSFVKRRD